MKLTKQLISQNSISLLFGALIRHFCWQYKHFIIKWNLFKNRFNRLTIKNYYYDWNMVSFEREIFDEEDRSIIGLDVQ